MGPKRIQCTDQRINLLRTMHGRRCKSQPLCAAWHRWEIDGLHVNAMLFQQHVRHFLRVHRVADHQGNDVAAVVNHRKAKPLKAQFQNARLGLVRITQVLIRLQVCNRRRSTGGNRRGGDGNRSLVALFANGGT